MQNVKKDIEKRQNEMEVPQVTTEQKKLNFINHELSWKILMYTIDDNQYNEAKWETG